MAESGLYCHIFTEGIFGIYPTGLDSFTLTPSLPKIWEKMALRHIKAFGEDFDIEVRREEERLKVEISDQNSILFSNNTNCI